MSLVSQAYIQLQNNTAKDQIIPLRPRIQG
jgi:hypothetical protein